MHTLFNVRSGAVVGIASALALAALYAQNSADGPSPFPSGSIAPSGSVVPHDDTRGNAPAIPASFPDKFRSFPLAEAFAQAAAWYAESIHQPPRWHLWIHVALAASEKASFMCLDPLLRKKASKAGVALVPAKL